MSRTQEFARRHWNLVWIAAALAAIGTIFAPKLAVRGSVALEYHTAPSATPGWLGFALVALAWLLVPASLSRKSAAYGLLLASVATAVAIPDTVTGGWSGSLAACLAVASMLGIAGWLVLRAATFGGYIGLPLPLVMPALGRLENDITTIWISAVGVALATALLCEVLNRILPEMKIDLTITGAIAVTLVTGLGLLTLGFFLQAHYGTEDRLCNTVYGEIASEESVHSSLSCGAAEFAVVMHWAVLICGVIAIAASALLAASSLIDLASRRGGRQHLPADPPA